MARGELFDKKTIVGFAGVNVQQEPDAIKDEQASDILNFRHAYTGYMNSRNGVRAIEFEIVLDPDFLSSHFEGCTSLGEYVLKTEVSSTEGMKFASGITSGGIAEVTTLTNHNAPYPMQKHDRYIFAGMRDSGHTKLAYVMFPLTQMPESRLEWNHSWKLSDVSGVLAPTPPLSTATTAIWFMSAEKPDGDPYGVRFQQPQRQMERMLDGSGNDLKWVDPDTGEMPYEALNWISEYQQVNQFQDELIIADRINGDMSLHDEYDEALPGETPVHRLRLAQNCKAEFDVDIVNIDYQTGAGEKNDMASSVQHGMALYKYYLQKSRGYGYVDHYRDNMVDYIGKDVEPERFNWTNGSVDYLGWKFENKVNKLLSNSGCFLRGMTGWIHLQETTSNGDKFPDLEGALKVLKAERSRNYIFSNLTTDTEYSDLLRRATLRNPDIPQTYDADSHVINQNASDVFIWEDLRIGYKVSGTTDHNKHLLRGVDRDFGKMIPVTPKTVTLKTHLDIEQKVQLGVYAYRFAWDFGNGDIGAASSVVMAGDLVWSALTNEELQSAKGAAGDYSGTKYRRESYFEGDGSEVAHTLSFSDFPVTSSADTAYKTLFNQIKAKLYTNSQKLGPGAGSEGDAAALITVYHPSDEIRLNGTVMEGVGMAIEINKADQNTDETVKATWASVSLNHIVVPLTKIATKYTTLNSVFTDIDDNVPYGLYRKQYPSLSISYELIFPEYGYPIGHGMGLHDPDPSKVFNEAGDELDQSLLPGAQYYAVTALCSASKKLVWGENYNSSEEIDIGNLNTNDYFGKDISAIRDKHDLLYNMVRSFVADTNNTTNGGGSTVLRFTSRQDQRFLNTAFDVPAEVVDRIIAQGIAGLNFVEFGDVGALRTEKYRDPNTAENTENNDDANEKCLDPDVPRAWVTETNGIIARDIPTVPVEVDRAGAKGHMMIVDEYTRASIVATDEAFGSLTDETTFVGNRYVKYVSHPNDPDLDTSSVKDPHIEDNTFSNLQISAYLPGERLMIPEQLSAYFPSSVLFNAPRVMISIAKEDIPRRARKLLVFRTLASHSNTWQPDSFGLVKAVDVEKDAAGAFKDFKFFDDVKDKDIDFTNTPDEYDGITKPLRSRFAIPWAKKMVYMNYIEHYQPQAPRGFLAQSGTLLGDLKPNYPTETADWNVSWEAFTDADNRSIGLRLYLDIVRYFVCFVDPFGIVSPLKMTPTIDLTSVTNRTAIALKLAGYPYTGAIEKCLVYRCVGTPHPTTNRYKKVGEIKPEDEGVFVDYGQVDGTEQWLHYDDTSGLPISPERVDVNESGIALSLANSPSWIKGTDREFLRRGDGDQITGGDVIYGDLIVFKEGSVHRITPRDVQGTIGRIEEVANQWGCIAPNTVLAHNSEVYFLSWNGLMKYNNNVFQSLDGDFGYELGLRLKDQYRGIINPGIRDASIALNPIYSELYLNIPVYAGEPGYDYHQKGLKGHVYVINLANGFATKFGYETGDRELFYPGGEETSTTLGTWERTLGRIYHKTTLGQLFSADILPKQVGLRSFIYIEAPTNREYDEFQPAIKADGTPETVNKIMNSSVHSWWRSKLFYEHSKTIVKKVRNAFAYFSRGKQMRIGAEFINDEYTPSSLTEAQFSVTGELQYVMPRRSPGHDRGERVHFHLASEGDSEVQAFEFYWREVNKFAR